MEPVSIIIGIVIGVLLTFAVLAVIGYRKKRQMERTMEAVFGKGGLDNLASIFGTPVLPDASQSSGIVNRPPKP